MILAKVLMIAGLIIIAMMGMIVIMMAMLIVQQHQVMVYTVLMMLGINYISWM